MYKENVIYVCVCVYSAIKKKEILTFVTAWVDLYGIIPSERSQTGKNKYCVIILICRILKLKIIESESRLVVTRGKRVGKKGDMVKGYKFPFIRWISSRDVMYSMMTTFNTMVLYI